MFLIKRMIISESLFAHKSFHGFMPSLMHHILVGIVSSDPSSNRSTNQQKSPKDTEDSTIPNTALRKSLLRRSSSEVSCYIIDHNPKFSDEHRDIVTESWHFITDHISEVGITESHVIVDIEFN